MPVQSSSWEEGFVRDPWSDNVSGVQGSSYAVVVVSSLSNVELLCDPMNCSPLGSSGRGISQARIMQWVAVSLGDLPDPGIEFVSPIFRWILYH